MLFIRLISIITAYQLIEICSTKDSLKWAINTNEFNGYIYKKTLSVQLYPEIKLNTANNFRICNFILTSKDGSDLPFLAEIKSSEKGLGNLVAVGPINAKQYIFYIKAKVCDADIFSDEMRVRLEVIKEEVPVWDQSVYEAHLYDDIPPGTKVVQVKAYEKGRSAGNSICNYKIIGPPNTPFDVDGNGVVRTKNRLNGLTQRNYILQVSAIDCWIPFPRNSTVTINVTVKHVCKLGWDGVYEQINYEPNSGMKKLGKNINFIKCNELDNQCQIEEVTAQLNLKNGNSKMCDRDLLSLRNQWKICGVNNNTRELLPSAEQFVRQGFGSADTSTGVYVFDGLETKWEIPTNIVSSDHFLGNNFTISFWMKHSKNFVNEQHIKEQILCNSDGDGKNRHHYSLFIHNCKLIFLFRTEPQEAYGSALSPAEWRFKTSEVCDNKWHHYSVIVQKNLLRNDKSGKSSFRDVKLFIDGGSFPYDIDNPEIIDDMPMHDLSEVHFTKLAIGACWHSKTKSYTQHFKGNLAGFTMLLGAKESPTVIECINRCHERLTFTGINEMAAGTSISINSKMSLMTVTASNVEDVGKIIREIGYINSRLSPIPGKRTIDILTTLKCANSKALMSVPKKSILLVVLSNTNSDNPESDDYKDIVLQISTDTVIEIVDQSEVSPGGPGLPFLRNIKITDNTQDNLGSLLIMGKPNIESRQRPYQINGVSTIDSCTLSVSPSLNHSFEYLTFTNNVIADLSDQGIYLELRNSTTGLHIQGNQSIYIYQFVLQRVVYYTSSLKQFHEKSFQLVCGKEFSHISSNAVTIKLKLASDLKAHSKSYHLETKIQEDDHISLNDFVHHGQSGVAKLNVEKYNKDSDLKKSNLTIVLSIFGIVSIALIVFGLIIMARNRNQRFSIPFYRSSSGPWVRLKPEALKFSNSRNQCKKIIAENTEMEWDSSEMCSSSILDESLQITVNPLVEHEKSIKAMTNCKKLTIPRKGLDAEEQSLDGLPDEYDGQSEDFRDIDDDMTVEEDYSSIIDENDLPKFYQTGHSLSYNAISNNGSNLSRRDWYNHINIHQNPRYSLDNCYSK